MFIYIYIYIYMCDLNRFNSRTLYLRKASCEYCIELYVRSLLLLMNFYVIQFFIYKYLLNSREERHKEYI